MSKLPEKQKQQKIVHNYSRKSRQRNSPNAPSELSPLNSHTSKFLPNEMYKLLPKLEELEASFDVPEAKAETSTLETTSVKRKRKKPIDFAVPEPKLRVKKPKKVNEKDQKQKREEKKEQQPPPILKDFTDPSHSNEVDSFAIEKDKSLQNNIGSFEISPRNTEISHPQNLSSMSTSTSTSAFTSSSTSVLSDDITKALPTDTSSPTQSLIPDPIHSSPLSNISLSPIYIPLKTSSHLEESEPLPSLPASPQPLLSTSNLPRSRVIHSSPEMTSVPSSPSLPPLSLAPNSPTILLTTSTVLPIYPHDTLTTKRNPSHKADDVSLLVQDETHGLSGRLDNVMKTSNLRSEKKDAIVKKVEKEEEASLDVSTRSTRRTKLLARKKIVGLFHRYGDFVKLKPSGTTEASDSDPDYVGPLSQNSSSSSDGPDPSFTQLSPSSPARTSSTKTPIPIVSDSEEKEPDLLGIFRAPKPMSISSSDLSLRQPNSNQMVTSIPFIEKENDLFDRMHVRSASGLKNKMDSPTITSTLTCSVLTQFLSPFMNEELPSFIRVAARTILKKAKKSMSSSQLIGHLYGHPEKKKIGFKSSQRVLSALINERKQVKRSSNTNLLSWIENEKLPHSQSRRVRQTRPRSLPSLRRREKKARSPSFSTSLPQIFKDQLSPEPVLEITHKRDLCHNITILNLPNSCTFCTLTILSGHTISLEQTVHVYDVEIVPSQISLLKPHVSIFLKNFLEDAKSDVIPNQVGPLMTHFLDTQFLISSSEMQKELSDLIVNAMIETRKIRNEKRNSPSLFVLGAWVALWLYIVRETNPNFQIELLTLLAKYHDFPLDTPFQDPFQALLLVSFQHVAHSELYGLTTLQATTERQWYYFFFIQVLQGHIYKDHQGRIICWDTLTTLIKKTESLDLTFRRLFQLVTVYHWNPVKKNVLYLFKDMLISSSTEIELHLVYPPVASTSSVTEQFFYLVDQVSFASSHARHEFVGRFLPSSLPSLPLTVVPYLFGLFFRSEWEISFFLSQLATLPRFLYTLPSFFIPLLSLIPHLRSSLLQYLLNELHASMETDSVLAERLLSMLVKCSEVYPRELRPLLAQAWHPRVASWLNPHYVPTHRCMVLTVLRNVFKLQVSMVREGGPAALHDLLLSNSMQNMNVSSEDQGNGIEVDKDAFDMSVVMEAENRYFKESSEQVKPILFTLERSILNIALHLQPSEIGLQLLEWQTSLSSRSLFLNTLHVCAMLLRIVEQVNSVTTEAILSRLTSFRWPSIDMPPFVKCFRTLVFAHHFFRFGARIPDIQMTEIFTVAAFDLAETPFHLLVIQDFLCIHKKNTLLSFCDLSDLKPLKNSRNTLVAAIFYSIGLTVQRRKSDLLSIIYQLLPHLQRLCSVIENLADFKNESVSPVHQLFSVISFESDIQHLDLPGAFTVLIQKVQTFLSPVASMLGYLALCNEENTDGMTFAFSQFTHFVQSANKIEIANFISKVSSDLQTPLFKFLINFLESNLNIQNTLEIFILCFTQSKKITRVAMEPVLFFIPKLMKFLEIPSQFNKMISKTIWTLLSILLSETCYLTESRAYFPEADFHLLGSIVRMMFPFSLEQLSKYNNNKLEVPISIASHSTENLSFFLFKYQLQVIDPMNFRGASHISPQEVDIQLFESILNFFVSCYFTDPLLREFLISIQYGLTKDFEKGDGSYYSLWSNIYLVGIGATTPKALLW